jgi:hypothetical protein
MPGVRRHDRARRDALSVVQAADRMMRRAYCTSSVPSGCSVSTSPVS